MADDYPDWIYWLESVYFLDEYDESTGGYIVSVKRRDDEGNCLTQEEEYDLMTKEVNDSEGFEIDFSRFRYNFNYRPVDLDDNEIAIEPETTRELVDRLSRISLEQYNAEQKKEFEIVKFIKANYHSAAAGAMFFITFQGKDSCDDEPKHFQAKYYYSYVAVSKYVYCDLKREENVHYIESAEKEGEKKPRLVQALVILIDDS